MKIVAIMFLLSTELFAGPQHIIIPRMRETARMGSLYTRELPAGSSYETYRRYEDSNGGNSFRRAKENEMRRRCFQNDDERACEYLRKYL